MMRKKIYSFAICLCAMLCVGVFAPIYAQDTGDTTAGEALTEEICPDYVINLQGQALVKAGISQEYTWEITDDSFEDLLTQQRYVLYKGEEQISESSVRSIALEFEPGVDYRLEVDVRNEQDCNRQDEIDITATEFLYTYVGEESDEITTSNNFWSHSGSVLYDIPLEIENNLPQEQLLSIISQERYYLQHADVLLIDGKSLSPFFSSLASLQNIAPIELSDSSVYVFSNINQSAFRRLMSRYRHVSGVEQMYIVDQSLAGSLMASLLSGKDPQQLDYVTNYSLTPSNKSPVWLVSRAVDYLLYNDFPLDTLLFVLLLPLVVLIISVFRQVIGLSVFGVFHPLLFALSLYIMGIVPTAIFFFAAFVATVIVRYFTAWLYLLYSAKIALLITIYCLISLACMWGAHQVDPTLMSFSLFENYYILFPFIFLIIIGNRVFSEKFTLLDKGRWKGLLEFIFVSALVYWVLRSVSVQNIMLGYPEIAVLCLLGIVLVGRFTGLQVLEYIRFMPLIRHHFDDEEE